MKKLLLVLLIFLVIGAGILFTFWKEIFQVSAEEIIKKNLPPYVVVDRIIFDFEKMELRVQGLGIKNPKGYQNKFLAFIDSIVCSYKMQGKSILDGIEVTAVKADGATINIERRADERVNINEMEAVMNPAGERTAAPAEKKKEAPPQGPARPGEKKFNIADLVKLTDTINIRDAKVVFLDKAVKPSPYMVTFEDAKTDVILRLNQDYTAVRSVASKGTGNLNGDRGQRIDWDISFDPQASALTMSSRFGLSGINVIPFKPYYEKYSPVEIESARCSGTLVFDFDHGNIGSTNTLNISDLKFKEKSGGSSQNFWDVGISDIIKYLESSPGNVTFDFKIKGTMDSPKFYPGPVVKQAIQEMAIDKISGLFEKPQEGGAEGAAQTEKSDAEKIMDALQGLLKK